MRASTTLLNSLLARAVLAVVLLFAQQTAALHWLSHAIEATHAKVETGTAPADHCDECLALGALGSATPSTPITIPLGTAQHSLAAQPSDILTIALLRLAFRSRAPPTLI
jgi:hypothetical protein